LIGPLTAFWFYRSVPDPYSGYVAVVAQDTQGAGTQQKVLAAARGEPNPARGEHAQHMSVREQSNITINLA
jgi:hypothetical protein